tara:strand:- start:13 stop:273 length:261 start_codon:yes stop_codon:yes gene_type:complete
MIKEIKYILYALVVFLFLFFTIKYYLSDDFEKKFYKTLNKYEDSINSYANKLTTLENNTNNVIEYIDNNKNDSEKKYQFWKLLDND